MEVREVRAVIFDISKAFDNVWHDALVFKLKQNGIKGRALTLLSNYFLLPNSRGGGGSNNFFGVGAGVGGGGWHTTDKQYLVYFCVVGLSCKKHCIALFKYYFTFSNSSVSNVLKKWVYLMFCYLKEKLFRFYDISLLWMNDVWMICLVEIIYCLRWCGWGGGGC